MNSLYSISITPENRFAHQSLSTIKPNQNLMSFNSQAPNTEVDFGSRTFNKKRGILPSALLLASLILGLLGFKFNKDIKGHYYDARPALVEVNNKLQKPLIRAKTSPQCLEIDGNCPDPNITESYQKYFNSLLGFLEDLSSVEGNQPVFEFIRTELSEFAKTSDEDLLEMLQHNVNYDNYNTDIETGIVNLTTTRKTAADLNPAESLRIWCNQRLPAIPEPDQEKFEERCQKAINMIQEVNNTGQQVLHSNLALVLADICFVLGLLTIPLAFRPPQPPRLTARDFTSVKKNPTGRRT